MQTSLKFAAFGALAAISACASSNAAPQPIAVLTPPQIDDPYFVAASERLAQAPSTERTRNVIIFIGDGMGISTVTASRIFAGQRAGRDGESNQLTMDTFPHTALSRTYGNDAQVSDSAPTATALLSGVKANNGVIGLTSAAPPDLCDGSQAYISQSLFEMAEANGFATGIVSTARITHATPAAAYAHTPNRDWENDAVAARTGGADCVDIARQLVEWTAGDGFEVAFGGGRTNFLPNTSADPENPSVRGARADGRDLVAEWTSRPGRAYVWNAEQLASVDADAQVLALFSPSHMAYENDRARDVGGEPSIAEMTAAAIERLSRHEGGYVLLVEGGRIDHAHHAGEAAQALSETVAFDEAVRTALEMTSREDTLIIVTADHSHVFTIAGYPQRGNPILGLAGSEAGPYRAADGLPYTTLGYANGPGAMFAPQTDGQPPAPVQRPDLTGVDTTAPNYRVQALVPMESETHAGEDVAIYAWGPTDEAVAGTLEQNMVFHIMARALGFEWSAAE